VDKGSSSPTSPLQCAAFLVLFFFCLVMLLSVLAILTVDCICSVDCFWLCCQHYKNNSVTYLLFLSSFPHRCSSPPRLLGLFPECLGATGNGYIPDFFLKVYYCPIPIPPTHSLPPHYPGIFSTLGKRAFTGPRASPIDARQCHPLLHMWLEPWVPPYVLTGW